MTAPQRMPQPFDVVRVRPGHNLDTRDLTSVLLTVHDVSEDGKEVDCTEYTGGPLLHFLVSALLWVFPAGGAW